MYRKYTDEDAEAVRAAYRKTGSGVKAAKIAGTSQSYAYRVLRKAGLTSGQTPYGEDLIDRAERLYVDSALSCRRVADRLGVSQQWVYEKMRERGVLRQKNYEQHPVRYLDYDGTQLQLRGRHGPDKVRQVLDAYARGASPQDLSEQYDAPVSTIEKWTARAGVARSHREAAAQRRINEGHVSPIANARTAERLYTDEHMSTIEIADELGVSVASVLDYLDERGVERRTRQEAMFVRWHGSLDTYRAFVQEVCRLRHREGLTQAAICQQLDVTYRTVRRALDSKYNPYREAPGNADADDDEALPWWAEALMRAPNSPRGSDPDIRPYTLPKR